jgi:hypothetical protein
MKITRMLLCGAIAGAVAFASTNKASAVQYLPLVKVNISASITYQGPTTDNGTVTKVTVKKVSGNTKALIALLNASPTFQAALTNEFGSVSSNQVPSGSYFVYDPYEEELIITNKNGFSFNLDSNNSGRDFGYLDFDDDVLFGSYSINDTTGAGSENDTTGIYFYLYDYNGNYIESYGTGTFKWKYGAVSGGDQKMTLSVSLKPNGYYAEVDGNEGLVTSGSISGSGTATLPTLDEPFYYWW